MTYIMATYNTYKCQYNNFWRYVMKKLYSITGVVIIILIFYFILRPVHVIHAEQYESNAIIVVDHLPLTNKGKISWWKKTKSSIAMRYQFVNAPENASENYIIFSIGSGFHSEDQKDRFCLRNVKPPQNCIDKIPLMTIHKSPYGREEFMMD